MVDKRKKKNLCIRRSENEGDGRIWVIVSVFDSMGCVYSHETSTPSLCSPCGLLCWHHHNLHYLLPRLVSCFTPTLCFSWRSAYKCTHVVSTPITLLLVIVHANCFPQYVLRRMPPYPNHNWDRKHTGTVSRRPKKQPSDMFNRNNTLSTPMQRWRWGRLPYQRWRERWQTWVTMRRQYCHMIECVFFVRTSMSDLCFFWCFCWHWWSESHL